MILNCYHESIMQVKTRIEGEVKVEKSQIKYNRLYHVVEKKWRELSHEVQNVQHKKSIGMLKCDCYTTEGF